MPDGVQPECGQIYVCMYVYVYIYQVGQSWRVPPNSTAINIKFNVRRQLKLLQTRPIGAN